MAERVFITGGAGFIGSHFTDHLLADPGVRGVTLYDNFSSGREWHVEHHREDLRLTVVRGDLRDLEPLRRAMEGHDLVIHLASNPDIARAVREPAIDFDQGTLLTNHVLEAMRTTGARTIIYTSGSGVYGDLGEATAEEDHGPLVPISTYGASKLAGEAMISAYCHLFGFTGVVLRLANVVGPRQTHGVGLDFVRRLVEDPSALRILGDGRQSKSYIYVSDVVDAAMLANQKVAPGYHAFNVATEDYESVRDIALLALDVLGLPARSTRFVFTGGDRGWQGDIPVVRMSSKRIRALGWSNAMSSREALGASMRALLDELRAGRQ